jgi:hypothetical protein
MTFSSCCSYTSSWTSGKTGLLHRSSSARLMATGSPSPLSVWNSQYAGMSRSAQDVAKITLRTWNTVSKAVSCVGRLCKGCSIHTPGKDTQPLHARQQPVSSPMPPGAVSICSMRLAWVRLNRRSMTVGERFSLRTGSALRNPASSIAFHKGIFAEGPTGRITPGRPLRGEGIRIRFTIIGKFRHHESRTQ